MSLKPTVRRIEQPPFTRLALVDEMLLNKLKEDNALNTDPIPKALVKLKESMDVLLNEEPNRDADQRLAIYNLLKQRFDELLAKTWAPSPATRVVSPTPPAPPVGDTTAAAAPAPIDKPTSAPGKPEEEATGDEEAKGGEEEDVIKWRGPSLGKMKYSTVSIPKQHHKKYEKLMQFIADNPKIIGESEYGEVTVAGEAKRGTSLRNVIRSMFIDSGFDASGMDNLMYALRLANVPENLIVSKRAKTSYADVGKQIAVYRQKAAPQASLPNPFKQELKPEAKQSGSGKLKRRLQPKQQDNTPPGRKPRLLIMYK